MKSHCVVWLPLLSVVCLAGIAEAAPKRDRQVIVRYEPGSLGHGVRQPVAGVQAQIQKKTAFVWISRGKSKYMKNSGAVLQFSSRNWKNVRVRIRPKAVDWVTLKRTKLLSGPADLEYGLPELGKKETGLDFRLPASYEVEAQNVLFRTLEKMGVKADMVVRFRDQLKPKGESTLKAHKKRVTVDFSQLRPTVVGHLAAMVALVQQDLVHAGTKVPVPTQLKGAMSKTSNDPVQLALIYLYGKSVSVPLGDGHRPKSGEDGNKIPLNIAGLLRDLRDGGREEGGQGAYDTIQVRNLRQAIKRVYRASAPDLVVVSTPAGGVVPVPGSGNPIRLWDDLIQRLAPEASAGDVWAIMRLNGVGAREIVW